MEARPLLTSLSSNSYRMKLEIVEELRSKATQPKNAFLNFLIKSLLKRPDYGRYELKLRKV